MAMEEVDLVIVGAGWNGLAAAKTYREVNPSKHMVVLDSSASVGGVWASERLYKGLKSNNFGGTYEFSDFPMTEECFGVTDDKHIPADAIHRYFEAFVQEFGLADSIRLGHRVASVEYTPDKDWVIAVTAASGEGQRTVTQSIKTSKLIIATGLTSQPSIPEFEGQDQFDAPLFHVRDLPANEKKITSPEKAPVTVFGGTKSAWDVVYQCASAGVPVNWVIRESGHGPAWMAPMLVTPLKIPLASFPVTRLVSLFSPCIWGAADGFARARRWLHGTWLGRKIVDGFWGALHMDVHRINRYGDHEETKKLEPWIHPFWVASSFGILNYPTDIMKYLRDGLVKVHTADIDRLSRHTVHLSTGEDLLTSVLVCCTGWKATSDIKFLPEGIATDLGLCDTPDIMDQSMLDEAKHEIMSHFPKLKNQPPAERVNVKPVNPAVVPRHPLRLVRFMVPPRMLHDRSIVFLGTTLSFHTVLVAQAQALWAVAYLERGLSLTTSPSVYSDPKHQVTEGLQRSDSDILYETALHTEFTRWRHPGGFGYRNPDFVFDVLPYIDLLLKDLKLSAQRKSRWWAHLFHTHGPDDYRGLVQEWKETKDRAGFMETQHVMVKGTMN